jgi:hypothetical protein
MKLLLIGAASLTAVTAAFANLGDSRADSAQRYGRPDWKPGQPNVGYYTRGNWWIAEWYNSMGYVVDITYYKQAGTISKKETETIQAANIPSPSGWYPLKTTNDNPKHAVGQVYLSNDNTYRFEGGSCRLFDDNRWFSYVEFSTIAGHIDMVTDTRQRNQQPAQVNNDDGMVPL